MSVKRQLAFNSNVELNARLASMLYESAGVRSCQEKRFFAFIKPTECLSFVLAAAPAEYKQLRGFTYVYDLLRSDKNHCRRC